MIMPELSMRYSFDGIAHEDMIVAVYFMEIGKGGNVVSRIRNVSNLIYPGAWVEMTSDAEEAWEKYAARVVGIYETPPYEIEVPPDVQRRQFIVHLAIPLANIDPNLPSLLTSVAGEIQAYGNIKLIDLYLPRSYVENYSGPKFGPVGIREILNVRDRPLLLGIMKPSQGYTPEQGAAFFFEAAIGGVDIIKDEELLSDPDYCRRTERIELYMAAERRAFEETGEHTLYAVNITDQADRLVPNALEAVELGANALMVNYMQVGLDTVRMLCEDARVTVPVLGHNTGSTSMLAATHTGISMPLINGKLPRLCGVDMGIVLSGEGSFPVLRERCLLLVREMLSPFYGIRPVLPVIASGITPGRAGKLIRQYGSDMVLGSGSCIFGHPQGPAAGARAFRQVIRAVTEGRKIEDAAQEHQELEEALNLWGGPD
jgi:2,3-diketo-5-methylthiopentyl-1-phosphate enolase